MVETLDPFFLVFPLVCNQRLGFPSFRMTCICPFFRWRLLADATALNRKMPNDLKFENDLLN